MLSVLAQDGKPDLKLLHFLVAAIIGMIRLSSDPCHGRQVGPTLEYDEGQRWTGELGQQRPRAKLLVLLVLLVLNTVKYGTFELLSR